MPDENPEAPGQVPAAPAGQVPTEVKTDLTPEAPANPEVPDPKVTRANQEAAAARVKAKDLENRLNALETEHAAKLQEANDAALAAKKEAQDAKAEAAAVKLGLVDADAAKKLLNWDAVNSSAKTIDEAMAELVTEKPWLLAKPVTSAPNLAPTNPNSNTPRLTAADLKTMTRDEIQALPETELFEALSRV